MNRKEKKITFKIKKGYYLELLMTYTMKLLESTKRKLTKDKNCENVSHLKISGVVIVCCNAVDNNYQQDSRVLYTFVPNKSFRHFTHRIYIFKKFLIHNFRILKYGLLIKTLNL